MGRRRNVPSPPPLVRATSRFTEGSMNDRVSAVPPREFIGPELEHSTSAGAIEGSRKDSISSPTSSYEHSNNPSIPSTRPRSASASMMPAKEKRSGGFLAPLWEGFREKLSFGRGGKGRPMSVDGGGVVGRRVANSTVSVAASAPVAREEEKDDARRPTREEILANYHQLVDSGFFTSHAIQSTRRPMPTTQTSQTDAPGIFMVPRPAKIPEETTIPTENEQLRSQARNRELPAFYARPQPDKRPKRQPLAGSAPRPRPIPNNPHIANPNTLNPSTGPSVRSPEARGKKRTHEADDDDGGKARKLRKASSRISTDSISIPNLRKAFKRGVDPATSSTEDVDGADPRSLPPPPKLGILTRRSFSNSSHRETNKLAKRSGNPSSNSSSSRPGSAKSNHHRPLQISGPVSEMVRLPPGAFDAMREGNGTVMDLHPKAVSGPAPAMSMPLAATKVSSPHQHQQQQQQQQQQPFWAQKPQPQQRAQRPLSVVPDANRGIPRVPEIPGKFKGSNHAGDGDENGDVEMMGTTFYFEDSMVEG